MKISDSHTDLPTLETSYAWYPDANGLVLGRWEGTSYCVAHAGAPSRPVDTDLTSSGGGIAFAVRNLPLALLPRRSTHCVVIACRDKRSQRQHGWYGSRPVESSRKRYSQNTEGKVVFYLHGVNFRAAAWGNL